MSPLLSGVILAQEPQRGPEPPEAQGSEWVQKDKITNELEHLGLTSYEATAYRTLLRRRSFTAPDLSRTTRIPRQRIYDVIDTLMDKGLCQPQSSSPLTVVAVPPSLALKALGERRISELEGEREEVQNLAVSLAMNLQVPYQEGQDQKVPLSYLDLYRDRAQMAAVAQGLGRTAAKEIKLYLTGPSALDREVHIQLVDEALSRGVSCRALCGPGASFSQEFGSLMTTYARQSLAVRRLEGSGVSGPRMQIFDETAVLLFFPDPLAGQPEFQALAIRHPQMLALMNFTFESLWELKRAKDVDAQGHTLA